MDNMDGNSNTTKMSATDLPNEILEEIFMHLPGRQVIHSRRVCLRWRDVIDYLPDSFWQKKCQIEDLGDDYAAIRYKCNLSGRVIYKALNSWHRINKLPMKVRKCDLGIKIRDFKVLPNGIISLVTINDDLQIGGSAIIYYKLDSWQECDRIEFSFNLIHYSENDHLVVVEHMFNDIPRLCIISKSDKQRQHHYVESTEPKYKTTLIENEIFMFPHQDNNVIILKMTEDNGKYVLKTELLPFPGIRKISVINKNNGFLYLLHVDGTIFRYTDKSFEVVYKIERYSPDIFKKLKSYGLDWRCLDIYKWVTNLPRIRYKKYRHVYNILHGHGNVIMAVSFYEPALRFLLTNNASFDLNELKKKADRTVRLDKFVSRNLRGQYLTYELQLDIIESEFCHKVFILAYQDLYVLEFYYSTRDRKHHSGKRPYARSRRASRPASSRSRSPCGIQHNRE